MKVKLANSVLEMLEDDSESLKGGAKEDKRDV